MLFPCLFRRACSPWKEVASSVVPNPRTKSLKEYDSLVPGKGEAHRNLRFFFLGDKEVHPVEKLIRVAIHYLLGI
jgi:hypothetical protein